MGEWNRMHKRPWPEPFSHCGAARTRTHVLVGCRFFIFRFTFASGNRLGFECRPRSFTIKRKKCKANCFADTQEKTFMDYEADYLIVGAGSAGCVLANRLSVDPRNLVLLLEAGGPDNNPWIHIPVGYFKTMHDPEYDWCYRTKADTGTGGRRIDWPRGKVLGGSSSLNGLLYVRGQREDYDHWSKLGNKGWSFAEVLPYFKKSEDQERGEDHYH